MATIFANAFVPITPVPLSPTTAVIGYDRRLQTPVLDLGSGPVSFEEVMRADFESGEMRFTEAQQQMIVESVAHLVA